MGLIDRCRPFMPLKRWREPPPLVPVVRLTGMIAAGRGGLRGSTLNLANLAETLDRAFGQSRAKAVAFVVNSPGGAPAQSALIARRIQQLSAEKKIPTVAFVEDVAASGGYWLACAADEIYADATSIVGSIGVIAAGFGFQDLIARHGVERRLYTAGERKSLLDPFQTVKPEDEERLKDLQARLHDSFKVHVRDRRGERLTGDEDALFNGDVWLGEQALAHGLIDGLGDVRTVMRARFGDKVRLPVMNRARRWPWQGMGDSLIGGAMDTVEARAMWARWGL